MSRITIVILIYPCHKTTNHILTHVVNFLRKRALICNEWKRLFYGIGINWSIVFERKLERTLLGCRLNSCTSLETSGRLSCMWLSRMCKTRGISPEQLRDM
jgi:hypothetical protein